MKKGLQKGKIEMKSPKLLVQKKTLYFLMSMIINTNNKISNTSILVNNNIELCEGMFVIS